MRLRNLIAAAAAATSLLAFAAPVASAQRHPSSNGACRVSINLAPRLIEAGESALVFGRLRCAGRPRAAAGRTVRLLRHIVGVRGFGLPQATTTDSQGFYELVIAGIEFNSAFFVRAQGAQSATREVKVLAHVTLQGPPDGSQLLTGAANKVTFSGTVSPHDVGARVVLQRQNANAGNEWRRIDAGEVTATGAYSITHTFVVPGDANIRVLVHSQHRNVASPSQVLTYEISQAQNPRLTINASSNPIEFGQHVMITGTVAGDPNAVVALLAHTTAQPGFVAVAEAKSDGAGNYAFPAQAPVHNTFYEVRAADKLSAVLFEGVKDLLTAQASASSIRAGQALSFSGAVAPDHTAHVIYLERQDRLSGEFHVIEVGAVQPGSTYAIEHAVYDPGLKVFRVRIPGGPENEGASSPPFAISVTRAPAKALKPEAPSDTTLPAEGEG